MDYAIFGPVHRGILAWLTDNRTFVSAPRVGGIFLPRFWNFCDRMVMNDVAGMGRA